MQYNTQREQLVMPEYGRGVQMMVDMAAQIKDRAERQRCANTIVRIMSSLLPSTASKEDNEHRLWNHLARISHYKLDIDYPCDVSQALKITDKPEPMPYPMKAIPVRHYGYMVSEVFEKLKTMPAGPERDELTRITANQMKRCLFQWSHGSADDEKVANDLARFTDGVIQLDLDTFVFEKINERDFVEKKKKRK